MDSRQISTIATVFLIWVSPCSAQLFLGENVVVITAESGGEISGQVCNYSKNWCVEVSEDSGTARVEVELDYGELAGFSGQLDNAVVNLVEQHAIRNNYGAPLFLIDFATIKLLRQSVAGLEWVSCRVVASGLMTHGPFRFVDFGSGRFSGCAA
jgi:hypothetical protein